MLCPKWFHRNVIFCNNVQEICLSEYMYNLEPKMLLLPTSQHFKSKLEISICTTFYILGPIIYSFWWQTFVKIFYLDRDFAFSRCFNGIFPWRKWYIDTWIQIFTSELTYQSFNGALPLRICSIKAPAKWKISIEEYYKWLGTQRNN